MTQLIRNAISVRTSTVQGRGVFADKDISKDEIIEECPLLFIAEGNKTFLNYIFEIPTNDGEEKDKRSLLTLGYGSIYNHSTTPNATYIYDPEKLVMCFVAIAPIRRDEEIFIYYNTNWFGSRNLSMRRPSLKYRITKLIRKYRYLFRAGLIIASLLCLRSLLS